MNNNEFVNCYYHSLNFDSLNKNSFKKINDEWTIYNEEVKWGNIGWNGFFYCKIEYLNNYNKNKYNEIPILYSKYKLNIKEIEKKWNETYKDFEAEVKFKFSNIFKYSSWSPFNISYLKIFNALTNEEIKIKSRQIYYKSIENNLYCVQCLTDNKIYNIIFDEKEYKKLVSKSKEFTLKCKFKYLRENDYTSTGYELSWDEAILNEEIDYWNID
jgi:hypothetical protein